MSKLTESAIKTFSPACLHIQGSASFDELFGDMP